MNRFISFKTPTPDDSHTIERVVWNPIVHEEIFGEYCHYFLIRLRKLEGRIGHNILEFFNSIGIRAVCIYSIYGYFDLLVRLWATPIKIRWLSNAVSKDNSLIKEIREFRVTNISYEGWQEKIDTQAIVPFRPIIEKISDLDVLDGKVPIDDKVELLIKKGLIWRFTEVSAASFKFYIAISSVPTHQDVPQLVKNVCKFLNIQRRDIKLCNIAIYEGMGFSNFLIKLVVENYHDIWRCIERFIESEDLLDLRPTTYLIATTVVESDSIDCKWREPSKYLLQLLSLLDSSYAALLLHPKTPVSLHSEFESLFNEFLYLSNTDFRDHFLGLFQARLKESTSLLAEKLQFIFKIERLLSTFIQKICIDTFGKSDWWRIYKNDLDECSVEKKKNGSTKNPDELTYQEALIIIGKLRKNHSNLDANMDNIISKEDLTKLDAIAHIRNDLAHGRVHTIPDYVTRGWEKLARLVFNVGNAYNCLIQWQKSFQN